jgi:5-(carboxyamino)imidazole ribonucleotide synthase
VVLPGETIGILGGGQLGRMIAIEAKKMGYSVICLDPTPNSPCGQVADDQIVAEFDDLEAAIRLAGRSALVLYEFENIDGGVVRELEKRYRLPQKSRILSIAQDRFLEKTALLRAGFPVAPFKLIRNEGELSQAAAELGFPCMLKLSRGGYDGKGQLAIRDPGDLPAALEQVQGSNQEWVLEKMLSFTHECSAIVARNRAGETAVFPVAENIHRDNILFMSIVPARIPPETEAAAVKTALEIAEALDLVGLLAVEFFVVPEGLLVNELAPRPHNSGHYTLDACYTSQFEQLIRALCGLPFGSPDLLTPVVMVNILGEHLAQVLREIPHLPPDTKLHLYGKRGDISPKRKMGHLTIRAEVPGEVVNWANKFFI